MRSVGLEVATHGSVQKFLAAPRPDVAGYLVLDIRLPGITGLDYQTQLTAHGIQLPVVLKTGNGDIPMSVQGMKAGAVDFLTKPFRDQARFNADLLAFIRDQAVEAAA